MTRIIQLIKAFIVQVTGRKMYKIYKGHSKGQVVGVLLKTGDIKSPVFYKGLAPKAGERYGLSAVEVNGVIDHYIAMY